MTQERIWKLVHSMEQCRSQYLYEPTIDCLKSFLDGWLYDRGCAESTRFMVAFHQWVRERYSIQTSQLWSAIILFHSFGQRQALDKAFELFSEFTAKWSDDESRLHIKKSADIRDLLRRMKPKPALYLLEPTIDRLRAYLDGWSSANEYSNSSDFMRQFEKWLQSRYSCIHKQPWHSIIRFYSVDQYTALTDAFQLIESFEHETGG